MTEQQPYNVVRTYDDFELRRYPEHLLAEVTTDGPFKDAGNRAFRYLFAYISGENLSSQKVAMTAPVVQAGASEKIAMTAPVVQQGSTTTGLYEVAFVLPAGLTADSAPQPTSPRVRLRTVPEGVVATLRFRGGWSEANFTRHLEQLRTALAAAGLTAAGAPRYARFDPPFQPAFLRRNEVMLDID
ncbi:SOUL family heme-binding protein [Cryobacterium psychrophilum]|uniref:Heme-binding protein n=1 Tax=Cryobacterium psychrophilum TaxID=41988 RepID=A0A4Y8KRZ8_9MICO|nr:heme-binding protein [Cryobacterium psychrophilum]TDW28745.1 SOUL heme-binding protein [Cryobacterium psychrophilum]TFD82400.1 heme-binding protein [Cryobacterium psychrophilum]